MVQGFVEQSKGMITVDSEPNVGTVMRIYLPGSEEKIPSKRGREQYSNTLSDLSGSEKIVIAEDDDAVRKFVSNALQHYGYQTSSYTNAEDALADIDENTDMLLTDIVMANGNGIDLGQKALNKNPAARAVYDRDC